jgi:hypothetical protein
MMKNYQIVPKSTFYNFCKSVGHKEKDFEPSNFSSSHATFLDGFPYADLKCPFLYLLDLEKNIFPHIHALPIGQQVYTHVSPLQTVYIEFPCHFMRSMILDLPYTGNAATQTFSSI